MKKVTAFSGILLVALACLSVVGCKDKAGVYRFEPRYYLRADRNLSQNLSSFIGSVALYADNKVNGTIIDWSFKIYDGAEEILEINLDNYNSFWFPVVLDPFEPAIIYLEQNGVINLFANFHDTITTVPGDMFDGKTPDNSLLSCTIRDERGNTHTIEAQLVIPFTETQ